MAERRRMTINEVVEKLLTEEYLDFRDRCAASPSS
jgi:hypothetical protein